MNSLMDKIRHLYTIDHLEDIITVHIEDYLTFAENQ